MSAKQCRDRIAAITRQQGVVQNVLVNARAAASKHRHDASKEIAKVTPKTSDSSARTYQCCRAGREPPRRNAEYFENRAVIEDKKSAKAATKLSDLAKDLTSAQASLGREEQATARREGNRRKADA